MLDVPTRHPFFAITLVITALFLAPLGCNKEDAESGNTSTNPADSQSTEDVTEDSADPCLSDPTAPGCEPTGNGELCDACSADSDCGENGRCVADARGTTFCSFQCGYFGDNTCPNDYYCKQFGNSPLEFFCWPLVGVCEEDGLDCSPCKTTGDCADDLVCIEPLGDILFCARPCEGDGTCPYSGTGCGHLDGFAGSLCLPIIDGAPTAKCGARPMDFCEPCRTNGQCKTGVCVDSPNIGSICSKSCSANDDCPSGTDCVQGACVPPIAHGCQGFLSCFGVECQSSEVCHRGFCIPAP